MTLELALWGENEVEARAAGEAWIAAEPAVESGKVVGLVQHPSGQPRWTVTVELVMRPHYEQAELGLTA